jgi:hypothetical protein
MDFLTQGDVMRKKVMLLILISMILSACSALAPNTNENFVEDEVVELESRASNSDQVSESHPLESEGDTPAAAEPEEVSYSLPDPNPINLSIQIDDQQAVEAEIGLQGGTLELATREGDRFILEIPPGALLSPETIQMTAIANLDGLPFEHQGTIAINLQPEGLIFFKMGTLRILPRSLSVDGDMLGFGTEGNGADFHLQPSVEDGNEVKLPIFHFSNYGITQATSEVIQHINNVYSPSTASKYAWDQMTSINKLVSDDDAKLEAFGKILIQWLYGSVLTRIENAAVFEDRIDYAVGEYRQWIDFIDYADYVFGLDGRMRERLLGEIEIANDAMASTLFQLLERNYDHCISNKDPQAAIRMYRYGLTVTALDLWGRSGLDNDVMNGKVQNCFNFEFDFRSEVEGGQDDLFIVSHVVSRIPLNINNFSLAGASIRNQGEITFDTYDITPLPPNCEKATTPGELDVEIRFHLNYSLAKAWEIENTVIAILEFRENPTEFCIYPDFDYPYQWWALLFYGVNIEFFDSYSNLMIIDLIVEDEVQGIFAETILYGEVPGIPRGKEETRFSLVHMPK